MYVPFRVSEWRPGGAMKVALLVAFFVAALLVWGLLLAYGASPAQAATLTVNSLSDTTANDGQCTLREAIFNANANDQSGSTDCAAGSGSDLIRAGVTGTVQLGGALPELSGNLQIEGPGADRFTVRRDSGGDYRIFTVTSGSVVSISGITISNGNVPGGRGGGILNDGTLTVSGSTISGNRAIRGGGINNNSTLTTTGSTISGNFAGTGGGVESANDIGSSTFNSGNKTTITNSTISGNTASNRGGGVHNFDGLTVIEHSTITGNTAPSGEGSGVASVGDSGVRTEVLSSMISANQGTDVVVNGFVGFIPNTFASKGYNLIGSGNGISAFNQSGDQTNVNDPKLGALAGNGGPTETHALLVAGPARDAIPQGTNGCGTTFTQDQRGVARPQGGACDIGAFELSIITVNSLDEVTDDDGSCTLREAITAANDNTVTGPTPGECAAGSGAGSDLIELGVTGTVNLTGALPDLYSNLQIRGPGADRFTVRRDTGEDYRIFTVTSDSEVSISGITVSNGSVPASLGGGILNFGTLTLTGSTISGNSAFRGGGIFNDGGNLAISGSTISANQGNRGGGVANRRGALTINGSTISGNRAGDEGGGVSSTTSLSGDTTTITNSTISGNTATASGGGVSNNDGLTVVEHSTITKNTAPGGSGSGVASFGGERNRTEVLSTIISGNTNTDVDFTGVIGISTNTFASRGYNLIGDGNATDAFGQSSDQTNVGDPKLDVLSNNGGPTETHALLAGSPAIDKGNTDLTTDQRGERRPFNDPSIAPATGGDNSDIGSFEAQEVLNTAPSAVNDTYTTDEDEALTVAAPGVFSNDSDVDGDSLSVGSFTNGTHGTVTKSTDGTKLTYTPKPNYSGPDSFTYNASDGTEDSDNTTISITVKPVNDAPTVTVVAGSSSQSACLSNTTGRVTLKLSDVDNNAGALTLKAASSNTSLVRNSNATLGGSGGTHTATIETRTGRTGSSTVTITVSDGQSSNSVPVMVRAGGNGKDALGGTSGADLLLGRNGNDTLDGKGGDDVLCGAGGMMGLPAARAPTPSTAAWARTPPPTTTSRKEIPGRTSPDPRR